MLLDSLKFTLSQLGNLSDSLYYIGQLKQLYAKLEQYPQAYTYSQLESELNNRLNNQAGIASMENQLLASELALTRRKHEIEQLKHRNKTLLIWLMSLVTLIVSGSSVGLHRRNKVITRQAQELSSLNKELIQKNEQNELLRKEIHHRTKNNLQIIFSLLKMQERQANDELTQQHLQEARIRIESIAKLHEQLVNNHNVIDFHTFITQLIHNITNSIFGAKSGKLLTHLDIEQVIVTSEYILPLALIINEWITNTFKYAQPTSDVTEIYVTIHQTPTHIYLHYKDNGKPVLQHAPGFGGQIVNLFCQQMKAQLDRNPLNPFDYQLSLPYAQQN